MFKALGRSKPEGAGPAVLERTVSCTVDVPLDEVWAMVVDPSIPMTGDDRFVEGGWLPGHEPGVGAIAYSIRRGDDQPLRGTFSEVITWEPPRQLVWRGLVDSEVALTEVEWNLRELPQGVTVSGTLRIRVVKRLAEASVRRFEAALEGSAQKLAERLPLSFS